MSSNSSQELRWREEGVALPPLVESTGGSGFLRQLLIGRVPAEELSPKTLIPRLEHTPNPFPLTIFTAIHIVTKCHQRTT